MVKSTTIFATLAFLTLAFLTLAAAGFGAVVSSGSEVEPGNPEHLARMVLYAGLALFFSFLCSVAEAVLLSVSPSYIAHLRQKGKKSAALLEKVKTNVDESLAGILTLNTIAHTVGAGGAGAEAAAYFGDKYVGISMAVLTVLILFLSEIIPKTLGALYWRRLAVPTALFIRILSVVLFPLIWISEKLTSWITRGRAVQSIRREEFAALADVGERTGQLDPSESRILRNLFRFPELRAEDIMTPRTVVFSLQQDLTLEEVLENHPDIPFSRIPIYGGNRDDVTGFVLKVDILLTHLKEGGQVPLRDLKRELRAVMETASLEIVADEMLDRRDHLLLVVDEYGGVAGVVSLEDVVETLIGIEIVDEADKIDDLRHLARQKWAERMIRLGIDPRLDEKSTDMPENPSDPSI
jgi:CBS domain containing-hemolysin-like protein